MNDLKYIITVLTVSFIIYGLVLIFTPAGNTGKFFKSLVGVSLIAVVVLTVSRQGIEFKWDDTADTKRIAIDTAAVDDFTAELSENAVESYINGLLTQNGCKVNGLKVFTNISSDGGISIDRVEVECDSYQTETVKKIINSLSIHCVVTENNNG